MDLCHRYQVSCERVGVMVVFSFFSLSLSFFSFSVVLFRPSIEFVSCDARRRRMSEVDSERCLTMIVIPMK